MDHCCNCIDLLSLQVFSYVLLFAISFLCLNSVLEFTVSLQRMQLDIILTSLQDNSHVALLLGFGGAQSLDPLDSVGRKSLQYDTQLAEVLMKTLLRNLGFHAVCVIMLC